MSHENRNPIDEALAEVQSRKYQLDLSTALRFELFSILASINGEPTKEIEVLKKNINKHIRTPSLPLTFGQEEILRRVMEDDSTPNEVIQVRNKVVGDQLSMAMNIAVDYGLVTVKPLGYKKEPIAGRLMKKAGRVLSRRI